MSFGKFVTNLMRSMPGRVVDARQQVRQARRPAVAVDVAVAVDRLADEGDLLAALVGELPHLGGDVLGVPALLGAARRRHDAVGAELVAAELHADVRLERRRPHRRVARSGRSSRSWPSPRGATPRCAPATARAAACRSPSPARSVPAVGPAGRCRRRCRRAGRGGGSSPGPSGPCSPGRRAPSRGGAACGRAAGPGRNRSCPRRAGGRSRC